MTDPDSTRSYGVAERMPMYSQTADQNSSSRSVDHRHNSR